MTPTQINIKIASPQAHFDACLERAARGLCKARGIDPEAESPCNNPPPYRTVKNWILAAQELQEAHLVAMFVRTLP